MDSPFGVLGLDPGADEEEIKRAYRERVKEVHPDQGGSIEAFRRVRAAYERLDGGLRDPEALLDRDPDHDGSDERPRATTAEVTFLNYDVLTDHGWELDDEALFEKAAAADLDDANHGRFEVDPGESLLEAAESCGFAWPFACRGGACANCAIILRDGELSMPVNHVLPSEMTDRDIWLSCNGVPDSDELEVIYNAKYVPELEELLLPPRPFERAYSGD